MAGMTGFWGFLKTTFMTSRILPSNGMSGSSKGMNANAYATKKTVAQGMLDIALLTANASQLKYVLQVGEQHEFYILMLILISISILLQVILGILVLILTFINIDENTSAARAADSINMTAVIFSLLITALNTVLAPFTGPSQPFPGFSKELLADPNTAAAVNPTN